MVLLIAVVRGDESRTLRNVAIALDGNALDVDGALLFFAVRDSDAVTGRLHGKGRLRAEGVEVEVQWDAGNRLGGGIAIFDTLGCIQGLCLSVDAGLDTIRYDPLGQRSAIGRVHRRHLSPCGEDTQ